MITAINDNLIVKNIPYDTGGRIFIPPEFRKKLRVVQRGTVISAGEGTALLPMPVKAGNEVVYDKEVGQDITYKGETYRLLKNFHIICAR